MAHKARILLIEDDNLVREAIRLALVQMGYDVIAASNGNGGLQIFSESPIDLVLTDLVMPEIEGIDVIRTLKRIKSSVPILAMSGGGINAGDSYLALAKKLGASAVLTKPFTTKALEKALIDALPGQPPAKQFTFIVLDDDTDSRFLNRRALEKEFSRCLVIECETAERALDVSARCSPDAVITDHHLGCEDGADFVRRLRERGTSCPILMVTGSSDPNVHERAYAAGASHVFFGSNLNFASYLHRKLEA